MGGVRRVLLDTHALLWALTAPDELSPAARDLVADPSVELTVSAASAWELATKHRLGKLPHAEPLLFAFGSHLERLGARTLPVDDRHALLAGRLDWTHRDPFDRMLAAQAITESLPLVTADRAFAMLVGLHLLW